MSVALLLMTAVVAADPPQAFTTADSPPEYGYGLTSHEARQGWLSLYDGQTDFGWKEAKIEDGLLAAGVTTTALRSGRVNRRRGRGWRTGRRQKDHFSNSG